MTHKMTFTYEELRMIRNSLIMEAYRLENDGDEDDKRRADAFENLAEKFTNEMRKDENFGRK